MANQIIGIPMPTNPQCGTCKTEQGLVRCPGCQVVFYCSCEHQAADWPQHKQTCKPIKITRNTMAAEVDRLIMPDSRMFRGRPFENSVGHFWGIVGTRDYMRARYGHVEALLKVKNRTAVQVALDHLLDMLHLNRSDNLGLRDFVPALYLRLGREQAFYDFIKWWYTRAQEDDYDSDNTDLPHNIENADALSL